MLEIFEWIVDKLSGFDFWFFIILLAIGRVGWHYLGLPKKKTTEHKTFKRQLLFAGSLVVIFVLGIYLHRLYSSLDFIFPTDVAGILILRIEGDDEKNSLQRDLVSTLNAELSQEKLVYKTEVRTHDETVTEALGLTSGHAKAREVGKNAKALLVIWGNRVGEKKFHPRLTIVEDWTRALTVSERTLKVQNITEVSLPAELVNQPIYLTHFVAGFNSYFRENYATAITHFKAALSRPVENSIDLNDIRFYTGSSHFEFAKGQTEMAWHLEQAIAYYNRVLDFYTEQNFPQKWANTQNNLGAAYWSLPTGNRSENLQKAIACYEAALRVRTEKDFPLDWARTQNNLGAAYWNLPTGDHGENLRKAIAAYEAALRVYAEKNFTVDWIITQNNLGSAYAKLSVGDRSANLRKAISAYEVALRVCSEKEFPVEWASIQNNLGFAYSSLPTGDRNEDLRKAIICYEAALRVRIEKNFPKDWASTQNNLGSAYWSLTTGDRGANLQMAITAFEAALRVYNENNFPLDWARIQNSLGAAYVKLPFGDRRENLTKAISCFENALKIWTPQAFPDYHQIAAAHLNGTQSELEKLLWK